MSVLQPDQVSFLLSQESARTRNRILSAVSEDQCIARVDFTVEADKSLIRFTYFETSPGWRRRGVAKALLIHLMHESRNTSLSRVVDLSTLRTGMSY